MTQIEFSRPIAIDSLGPSWSRHTLEATPEERAALAERFDLVTLDRLAGEVRLRRGRGGDIDFEAHVEADLAQACIVSLAPVPAQITEDFELTFRAYPAGEEPDDHDLEAPEPVEGGKIDMGEVLAQQVALALDPYPRAPEAAIPEEYRGDPEATDSLDSPEERPNPFAALEALKKR